MPKYIHTPIETARDIDALLSDSHRFELAVESVLRMGVGIDERHEWLCAVAKACHDMGLPEDEAAMMAANRLGHIAATAEQLLLLYYEPLPTRQPVEGDEWLSAMELYQRLERLSKKDLGIRRANTFGRILMKHCGKPGFKNGDHARLYHVRPRKNQCAQGETENQ